MIPIENSQEAREACDKIGEAIAVLTVGISDPATKKDEIHERRNRRVRCIPLFWRVLRPSKKFHFSLAIPSDGYKVKP